jgi:hypothetical protein
MTTRFNYQLEQNYHHANQNNNNNNKELSSKAILAKSFSNPGRATATSSRSGGTFDIGTII